MADPRSGVALPPGAPSPSPGGGPYGPGYGYGYGNQGFIGLAYDHQQDRWLPVGLRAVSPDGDRYAYAGPDGIYVVKVADSSISEIGEGRGWNLTDVESDGVYASQTNVGGLWWLPFSGAAQQITANGYWQAVGGGAAYGTATAAVPQGVSNVILRLDLKTGATRPWFMVDAGQSTVLGVDIKGAAIIQSTSFGSNNFTPGNGPWVQVWSVPSPGGATVMLDSDAFFGSGFNGPILDDSHGLWFNGSRGIYLIGQGDGRLHQATSYNGQLAGGCV